MIMEDLTAIDIIVGIRGTEEDTMIDADMMIIAMTQEDIMTNIGIAIGTINQCWMSCSSSN